MTYHATVSATLEPGSPSRLGAHFDGGGTNFAVFSEHAEQVFLCLFSPDGTREETRLPLPERTGAVWHGYLPGVRPGTLYGYRASGPYAPEAGHRFNRNKLLIDPYTREFHGAFTDHTANFGYQHAAPEADLSFDNRDSAPFVAKSVVSDPALFPLDGQPLSKGWQDTLIYEAHVKGLTMRHPGMPENLRGTYEGLASPVMLEHLTRLGVTAVELLPVQAIKSEGALSGRGLVNYWGYNTVGFFAPEPRYFGPAGVRGFRAMVDRFHAAGIEVILDVVYNHSAEGDHLGPTLSFRGLDNASYYRLQDDAPRYYVNDTGCGNTLNVTHPFVTRMILDSLRFWVQAMGVDGFRFDLAATLCREADGFDRTGRFMTALRQDPVLAEVKLIAEPWDIGPGGYQLGGFPAKFAEWNDRYRDTVRKFWRGDTHGAQELGSALLGTAYIFDKRGRRVWSSVNYAASHDGYTLADTTQYEERHNEANGEGNRDGHKENYSDNFGVEGPSDDPLICKQRARRHRNMLATVLLSQGTPMLLAGDEGGHTQHGNNNAYCQDNDTTWIDWASLDPDMIGFTAALSRFRRDNPILRQMDFLHGATRTTDRRKDVEWRGFDGKPLNWGDDSLSSLCLHLRGNAESMAGKALTDEAFLAFNRTDEDLDLVLPLTMPDLWVREIDTSESVQTPTPIVGERTPYPSTFGQCLCPESRVRAMSSADDSLRALAQAQGIYLDFHDLHGVRHEASPDTLRALLRALGLDADNPAHVSEALAAETADTGPTEVIAFAGDPITVPMTVPCDWSLLDEAGQIIAEGRATEGIHLPRLGIGYYDLHMTGAYTGQSFVMVRPHRAPDLGSKFGNDRCWGTTGALYGLRSATNGGLGNYSDLGAVAATFGQAGAQFLGVNPLHALGWAMEEIISPYSPSHRGMFNIDHISVAGGLGPTPDAGLIDYAGFRKRHRAALEAQFRTRDKAAFADWCETCSDETRQFADFEAISETHGHDFRTWPAALQTPGPATRKAAGKRAEFHLWLQYLADTQIDAAQHDACASGMALGLYLDLAVGPRPDGAEVWINANTIAKGVSIGAPPDHLSPEGQSWALAAHAPGPLARAHYAPLRSMLRRLMAKCGVLRIDHALGLLRSYWLPDDGSPGGYITQPLESLLAVITIEAHRAGCLVVGEDLGLVPDGFREAMNYAGLYSYAVWQFEANHLGEILPADTLPPYSLACFGTHDTPTLNGFWHGTDIEWWQRVGWLSTGDRATRHGQRARQRASLRDVCDIPVTAHIGEIADIIHGGLAQSPAALVSVQMDDVFGELEAQNLPGTINEHPNWRRRLSVPVEAMEQSPALRHISDLMREARGAAAHHDHTDHPKEVPA